MKYCSTCSISSNETPLFPKNSFFIYEDKFHHFHIPNIFHDNYICTTCLQIEMEVLADERKREDRNT
jgi:hypothetical protein